MKNSKNKFSGWLDTWRTPSKPTLGSVKYSFQELSTNPKLARKCFKQILGVCIEYKPGAKKLEDMTEVTTNLFLGGLG